MPLTTSVSYMSLASVASTRMCSPRVEHQLNLAASRPSSWWTPASWRRSARRRIPPSDAFFYCIKYIIVLIFPFLSVRPTLSLYSHDADHQPPCTERPETHDVRSGPSSQPRPSEKAHSMCGDRMCVPPSDASPARARFCYHDHYRCLQQKLLRRRRHVKLLASKTPRAAAVGQQGKGISKVVVIYSYPMFKQEGLRVVSAKGMFLFTDTWWYSVAMQRGVRHVGIQTTSVHTCMQRTSYLNVEMFKETTQPHLQAPEGCLVKPKRWDKRSAITWGHRGHFHTNIWTLIRILLGWLRLGWLKYLKVRLTYLNIT